MNGNRNLSEAPLPEDAGSAKNGHSPSFIFPQSASSQSNSDFANRRLLAVVLIMGAAFFWACWNFVHPGQTYSVKSLLVIVGMTKSWRNWRNLNRQKPDRLRAGAALGVLYATRASGGSLPELQRRPVVATGLSPKGGSDRSAHIRGLPGVLPARDLAGDAAPARTGTDATSGVGKVQSHDDSGRLWKTLAVLCQSVMQNNLTK